MLSEMCWLLTVPKTQMFSMPGQSQRSMESEARTQGVLQGPLDEWLFFSFYFLRTQSNAVTKAMLELTM